MTPAPTIARALARSGLVPLDAQVLLAHVVGRDRAWLVAHADAALTAAQSAAFEALARRRLAGEPVAYLTGVRELWGLAFEVSPAVLVPRPETEALVEVALARIPVDRGVSVLDLGTGSGAIAIAIAHERPRAMVLATDVSAEALAVARANAARLGAANVSFLVSDWFDRVPAGAPGVPFGLIVSNPPYVDSADPHLDEDVRRFEPAVALSPAGDPLAALRRIVGEAPRWLAPGGSLAVEHGYDQSARVCALFAAAGFRDVVVARDLAGIARVVAGSLPG